MSDKINHEYQSVVKFSAVPLGRLARISKPVIKFIYNQLLFRETCPLFLFGCMRSGSSLLSHILFSHPRIFGIGETHVVWNSRSSMAEAIFEAIRVSRHFPLPKIYFLDKILHNHLTPEPNFLSAFESSRVVVILRTPEDNISSLAKIKAVRDSGGISQAAVEYTSRLQFIHSIFDASPNLQPFLVKYEDLVQDPEDTLRSLQQYLRLDMPLQQDYKVQRVTGKWGYGDGSEYIRAGKILAIKHYHNQMGAELLDEAYHAYRRLERRLTRT